MHTVKMGVPTAGEMGIKMRGTQKASQEMVVRKQVFIDIKRLSFKIRNQNMMTGES